MIPIISMLFAKDADLDWKGLLLVLGLAVLFMVVILGGIYLAKVSSIS
jgi:hypothetical protein